MMKTHRNSQRPSLPEKRSTATDKRPGTRERPDAEIAKYSHLWKMAANSKGNPTPIIWELISVSCHLRFIVAGLLIPTLTSCSEDSGKSGSERSASKAKAVRRDLLKTYEMVVNAAAEPDLEQLEAGIQEVAKEYGYKVTVAQMKDLASTHVDHFMRLATMETLKPHLMKEEFEALAKTALDDKRRELLKAHTKKPQK